MQLKLLVVALCFISAIDGDPFGGQRSPHWQYQWQYYPPGKLPPQYRPHLLPRAHTGRYYESSSSEEDDTSEEEDLEGRIVGGHNARVGEIPHILYFKKNGDIHCGAVLVELQHIQFALTAAHCVWSGYPDPLSPVSPKSITIVAGDLNTADNSGTEQYRKPVKIVIHSRYDRDKQPHNDIAIMFLASPFRLTQVVQPILLPGPSFDYPTFLKMAGWGSMTTHQSTNYPDHLQVVTMNVMTLSDCKRYEYYGNIITNKQICVRERGFGTCAGDSGGPATSYNRKPNTTTFTDLRATALTNVVPVNIPRYLQEYPLTRIG
ncbi:Trypsin-1 [Orchesella cincta]|uniref:Trypsin-1 n=1 Tax=Orchesella cincta TaxID=48709 RepID=A0A1D2N1T4_ORCCI|nr:Trypsin-1 [Orchesella cincta]